MQKINSFLTLISITVIMFLLISLKTDISYAKPFSNIYNPISTTNTKEIKISPFEAAKQGQTIFIEIKTDKELINPYFSFKDRKYNLYKKENKYTGILGINALEKTGLHKITFSDDTGFLKDKAFINIVSSDFPKQYLKISKGMSQLKATAHELKQIQFAKNRLTPSAFWTDIPFNSPTKGCIISSFGLNRYYNGKFSGNYHKGIDIKADKGTPIQTITNGTVIVSDFFNLHGGTVAIDHGQGLMSIYLHMSKINVKNGDVVTLNQTIGEVGSTGFATGPHLHWGLYINGTPIDPMQNWVKPVKKCSGAL